MMANGCIRQCAWCAGEGTRKANLRENCTPTGRDPAFYAKRQMNLLTLAIGLAALSSMLMIAGVVLSVTTP